MIEMAEKRKRSFIKAIVFWEKIFLFLIALGAVAYFSLAFMQWGETFKELFLIKEDIESYIYLTVFLLAVSFVLRQLLVWVWRLEFKVEIKQAKAGRRRRRR